MICDSNWKCRLSAAYRTPFDLHLQYSQLKQSVSLLSIDRVRVSWLEHKKKEVFLMHDKISVFLWNRAANHVPLRSRARARASIRNNETFNRSSPFFFWIIWIILPATIKIDYLFESIDSWWHNKTTTKIVSQHYSNPSNLLLSTLVHRILKS